MPLFAALCGAAQITGGGCSAGEGKLKVTPGWRARRGARFLSALTLPTVPASGAGARALWLKELSTPPLQHNPTLFPLIFHIQG